jgi:type VI secretion system protein ImpE
VTAEESVRAGRLGEALTELQGAVRKQPADPRLRVFLFQLLVVMGQWERALTQLKVAGEMDPTALAMMQTYQEALRCEGLRAEVFAGKRTPLIFGKPDGWMALLLEALRLAGVEKFDEASQLRERAFEEAPATTGTVDGQPFAWIADADQRLGPMLEAVVNGKYYWIPFSRLSAIRVEKATDLRDLVWMPAQLMYANGGETVALIPTRYAGSEASTDSRVLMARTTEWVERAGGTFLGMGQRLLVTDAGEHPLMDVRVIKLDAKPDAVDAEPGAAGDAIDAG